LLGSEPKPNRLAALRERVRRLEQASPLAGHGYRPGQALPALRFGVPAVDDVLGGGLARGGLHEIAQAHATGADAGAASGFVIALLARLAAEAAGAVLWCLARPGLYEVGLPYGPGLAAYGLDPARLILARARRPAEVLWAMREGLEAGPLMAVVGEVDALDLAASRRLQLAAEASGVSAFLLRAVADERTPSAALSRWCIGAASGEGLPPFGLGWARPCWQVDLTRSRGGQGAPRGWLLEWHHETGDFAVAALSAERSASAVMRRAG
jgi:protein ImuA